MTALLEVRDLRVGYGELPVLQGIDFDVEAGSRTVLLGLNGAGKTTTVATIAGLLKPSAGTITFDGQRIDSRDPAVLVEKGIALVPEGRRTFPALTVAQNLRLGTWTKRQRKAELGETLERVYDYFPVLAERREQLAGTLSGGEQQMLAIGRALMNQPKVLTLDEPSLGLAPLLAKTILKIVRGFADDGVAVLVVEQNARQALSVADRAYVLETGRVALEGRAKDLAADERVQKAYLGGFETIAKEQEASEAAG